MSESSFDAAAGHHYFASRFFNAAWELLDKPARSPLENETLIATVYASICHWLNRPDCTSQNLSIGYWQASRAHCVLDRGEEARRLAELCLRESAGLSPFFVGYAHEALARAAHRLADHTARDRHLALARDLAAQVTEAGEREMLLADLANLAE